MAAGGSGQGVGVRVVLVCGRYAPRRDGVADAVRLLAGGLRERGDEVVVAGGGRALDPDGEQVVSLASRWDLAGTAAASRALGRLAAQGRVDVVHVHWAPSAFAFSAAAGLLPLALPRGLPVVTTLHEYGWWAWPTRVPAAAWPLVERLGWDRETALLGPRSRALIVTGETAADVVRERLGRDAAVIPIGASVVGPALAPQERAAAQAAARGELGLPLDAEVVAFFGFLHPVKGIRHLLDAVARLRAGAHPSLRLLVVGAVESLALRGEEAASYATELRTQISALGLGEAVRMTGWLPAEQVSQLLLAADVGALPFTHGVTAKSSSLLAAYAHGLPLVVTDPPGAADPTVVGVRCAVRDPLSLAAALDRLLQGEDLRGRLREEGLGWVRAQGWPGIAAAHAEVYARALGG